MKNFKQLLSATLVVVHLTAGAGTITLEWKVDSIRIDTAFPGGVFAPSDTIVFSNFINGAITTYNPAGMHYGLQFHNHSVTTIYNLLLLPEDAPSYTRSWHASPVLGVHGVGTKLIIRSPLFRGDNTYTKTSVALYDSGHLVLGKELNCDLVFPRYGNYTRQWWIYGDGTGTIELEDGFIADRSVNGTVAESYGSIRLNRATLITHNTASLPVYSMPDDGNPSYVRLNGHLVFENNSGVWIVKSNNQDYMGGIQMYVPVAICTETNLLISGKIWYWPNKNYYNYGGLMFYSSNRTLTKTGPARMTISGDMGCNPGSTLLINEGSVEMQTNPYDPARPMPGSISSGPHLTVIVNAAARFVVNTDSININRIQNNAMDAIIEIALGNTIVADSIVCAGVFEITNSNGLALNLNDVFVLFKAVTITGSFATINLPGLSSSLEWDISELYSHGRIKIVNATRVSGQVDDSDAVSIYPNPCSSGLTVSLCSLVPQKGLLTVFSADGKRTLNTSYLFVAGVNLINIDINSWPVGQYFIKIEMIDHCHFMSFVKE